MKMKLLQNSKGPNAENHEFFNIPSGNAVRALPAGIIYWLSTTDSITA